MSLGYAAFGTILKRGDGGGTEVFTAIAEIVKVDPVAAKADTQDVSTHSRTYTFTASGAVLTASANHGQALGSSARFTTTGTLPAGLSLNTDYWVTVLPGLATFEVATSLGGSTITTTDAGTGTHTVTFGKAREHIGTLNDGGELALELNFVPLNSQQNGTAGLILDMKNRTRRNFQLLLPDSSLISFSAFVVSFKPAAPVDGVLKGQCSLKITGAVTLP